MYSGRLVFSQVMDHLPLHTFRRYVHRYHGNHYVKSFTCVDQFLCMAFAQLTYRESLRGYRSVLTRTSRQALSYGDPRYGVGAIPWPHANKMRDWRMYAEFAQRWFALHVRFMLKMIWGSIWTIPCMHWILPRSILCLSVFPWALFRSSKSAVKVHTLLDLCGNIPTFIHISDGKLHDVKVLDLLIPEPGAFYVMDRAYVDFRRLYTLHAGGAFFVIRAKSNLKYRRRASRPVNKSEGLRCDQSIVLTGSSTSEKYPQLLRRIKYHDAKTGKSFDFLTNNFVISARTIAELYRHPLAGGIVFQVGQAAPAHQVVFWHLGERGKESDLDRGCGIFVSGDHKETIEYREQLVHDFCRF